MFSFLKKKEEKITLVSPIKGKCVALSQVNDPTFSECMLGKGAAVIPEEGNVYAPADGEISLVFDTKHAVSMVTPEGVEVLIHVGLDTVALKGEGFEAHVNAGDKVKQGDLLLSVDLEKIKAAGYDTITPMVVCNTDDYSDVQEVEKEKVEPGTAIITIIK